MSKICFKCDTLQPLDNFYKHSQMADGHLNKCKACTKRDAALNYQSNFARYQEYERKRFNTPERKAKSRKYIRNHRLQNPEKNLARSRIAYAVRSGKLQPKPCQVCGTTEKVEAHHPDYSKPLDVQWLCFTHHREAHRQATGSMRAQQHLIEQEY